jgi:hypothetical protein
MNRAATNKATGGSIYYRLASRLMLRPFDGPRATIGTILLTGFSVAGIKGYFHSVGPDGDKIWE